MKSEKVSVNTPFVLFGASGVLSRRLVVPAVSNLYLEGYLPERLRQVSVDRSDGNDTSIADHYLKRVAENSLSGNSPPEIWPASSKIRYLKIDATDA